MDQDQDIQNKLQNAYNTSNSENTESANNTPNLDKFKSALEEWTQFSINSTNQSTLETILSKPGSAIYIEEFLKAGFDVNYVNIALQKAAINFAADSLDKTNIEVLVKFGKSNGRCEVDLDYQYKGETALITLINKIGPKQEKIGDIVNCIVTLLRNGASPNISNSEGKTPLELIEENGDLDIENRSFLVLALLSASQLSEVEYRKRLQFLKDNSAEINNYLLKRAIQELKNWKLIMCFLESYKCSEPKIRDDLLKSLILAYGNESSSADAYEKCLQVFLEYNIGTKNNYILEELMSSAVQCQNSLAKKLLLSYGAQLTFTKTISKNDIKKIYDINDLGVDVVKEHFDKCITSYKNEPSDKKKTASDGQSSSGDTRIEMDKKKDKKKDKKNDKKDLCDNVTVTFDYKNFMTVRKEKNKDEKKMKMDLEPVFLISENKEMRHLLGHPLILCFLQLKWLCYHKFYIVNFLIFVGFNLSLMLQVFLRYPTKIEFKYGIWFLDLVCAGIVIFMIIEAISSYFMVQAIPKVIDLLLIVVLSLNVIEAFGFFNEELERFISIFSIMLMVLKLVALIGALPYGTISTHMLMLESVSKSFALALANFSIFLITFAICFYVLYGTSRAMSWYNPSNPFYKGEKSSQNNTEEESSQYPTLSKPNTALPATLIMFFGQFDMNDFNSFTYCWFMILFMIMGVIISNLLTSLAIIDTQEVKKEAEISGVICQLELIKKYDAAMRIDWGPFQRLRKFLLKLVNLYHECAYDGVIAYSNDKESKSHLRLKEEMRTTCSKKRDCYLHSGFQVHNKIITAALQIIENHELDVEEQKNSEDYIKIMSTLIQEELQKFVESRN